ncbi:hypothetical protein [Bdellovibrio sp. HCB2-146]|uniref:hypothetical protein n=1 Tax=Bdellovibrio sp. HCB2-146 TaxID=3394362 RepID=UPI0039BD2187
MKVSLLAFVLVLAGAMAPAAVLGEIQGQGSMEFTQAGKTRQGTCKVAMNVHTSAQEFELEFSVFECGALGSWNDPYVRLSVQGDKLVNAKGEVVGQVYADGTYKFTLKSSTLHKYQYEDLDFNCRIEGVRTRTLKLETNITYTVRNVGGGHYVVTRNEQRDTLKVITHKEHSNCRGSLGYDKDPVALSLNVVLR